MKRLLFLLILLAVSVWAGIQIQRDPGYILIAYRLWTVEMPVWAGLLLILASFIIFYTLIRLLSATGSIGRRLRSWSIRRRQRKARDRTSQGLIELAEGRWNEAEHDLLKAATSSEVPLINYLSAACAAQEQHAYERRDEYLRLAHRSNPDAEIAIGVVQAHLQLNHQQWEHALATLRRMLELAPKHQHILRLLKETYIQLGEWSPLAELLPLLRKTKAVTSAEANILQVVIAKEGLINTVRNKDMALLHRYWQGLPHSLQLNSEFLNIYIPVLIAHKDDKEAELILREALNKNWDEGLVNWYGQVTGTDPDRQLAMIETWLKAHPESPILLRAAGHVCLRNRLWGKARHYLEFSLQVEPHIETYLLLGELLAQLNEKEASAELYHKGLQAVVEDKQRLAWQA